MSDPFAHARPNWDHLSTLSASNASSRVPLAATAPVLKIYEEAVQEPTIECGNIDSLYSQAQLDDTDRYDARILREDFCSTALIATTWAGMDARNRSQAVDIDLVALKDTQRRLKNRLGFVQLLQSPAFSGQGEYTKVLPLEESETELPAQVVVQQGAEGAPKVEQVSDTWAPGAATERFDRKRNKKLAKQAKKAATLAAATVANQKPSSQVSATTTQVTSSAPKLQLLHSDVLSLPVPPISPTSSPNASALEAPDVIASFNYAMAYFHDRATLIRYLRMAKATLRPRTGVFITDMFGGPSTGESYPDQDETWARFQNEIGFARDGGDARGQQVLRSDRSKKHTTNAAHLQSIDGRGKNSSKPVSKEEELEGELELMPAPPVSAVGTRAEWPRGKLKLVRTGTEHGGFEYWREDGPVDWMTNRFRMSLSFRFSDASWLRDVFWYDFRVWSIKELTEAMEEVGFVRVSVHILPRNIVDSNKREADEQRKQQEQEQEQEQGEHMHAEQEGGDAGLDNMANLLIRTEHEEKNKSFYKKVNNGEKVFATRSFGTYIVACAP